MNHDKKRHGFSSRQGGKPGSPRPSPRIPGTGPVRVVPGTGPILSFGTAPVVGGRRQGVAGQRGIDTGTVRPVPRI